LINRVLRSAEALGKKVMIGVVSAGAVGMGRNGSGGLNVQFTSDAGGYGSGWLIAYDPNKAVNTQEMGDAIVQAIIQA